VASEAARGQASEATKQEASEAMSYCYIVEVCVAGRWLEWSKHFPMANEVSEKFVLHGANETLKSLRKQRVNARVVKETITTEIQ
jgi:hypothetical protein